MAIQPPEDRSPTSAPPPRRRPSDWRERFDAARERGVPLDPRSEHVAGVRAYPTSYEPQQLLVTDAERLEETLALLRQSASDFGWLVHLENLDGTRLEMEQAVARERRAAEEFDIPTVHRVRISRDPAPATGDQPVPPVDAWRLLQRARVRTEGDASRRSLLVGVGLDHVLSLDPFGGKTNPFGGKTNPYGGKTNPYGGTTNGTESYGEPGSGGRQVVGFVGADPVRTRELKEGGRRPVVAVLDTGCGIHRWLTDDIVTTYPRIGATVIGVAERRSDPELLGDVSGPYDGALDDAAGHGTFIAGIIRQVSPEADIVSVRVADSRGTLLEGDFLLAVRSLVKLMSLSAHQGGRQIDVLTLSLGYYHETPQDDLFDLTLARLLLALRQRGCAVVCSAGNDSTDRPTFPAALWNWDGADFEVPDAEEAAPHMSVGALNPNGTMALFSNLGAWVSTFAPGAAVVSASPGFNGGAQPGVRDDRDGIRRETIDPEDFSGGFAVWSGTSFAAPYVAGLLTRAIAGDLMSGAVATATDRVSALAQAEAVVVPALAKAGPRAV